MRDILQSVLLAVEKVLVWVAVVAMTVLMLLTTADAISRYIFNAPITGAYEVTEKYLMTAGIFLAFSYSYRGDVFIRVSFLINKFAVGPKLVCDYLAQFATLAYCVFFAYATFDQAVTGMAEGSNLSALPLPLAPTYFLVPIGFVAMTVLVLVDIPKVPTGESRLMPPEEGEGSQAGV